MSRDSKTLVVGRRKVEISRADKVLFPADGITKLDLAEYYRRVADVALPHYAERAVTVHRFPDGIDKDGFFQKAVPQHFPDWIGTVTVDKEDGTITHVVVGDAATLVYLADQACITHHLSLFRIDQPSRPDRLVFDLDPADDDFAKVRLTARHLRDLLNELGLTSFLQTTGSRGLHVVVPLRRETGFDEVRDFARRVGAELVRRHPGDVTIAQRKDQRGTAVFIDYLRNAYGQTAVAPYAVRALPGAPVATPIDWKELDRADLTPRRYTLRSVLRRLGQKQDPWAGMGRHAQTLARPVEALSRIEET